MKTILHINQDKNSANQPDLIGTIDVDGTARRVAIWEHDENGSIYYSGKLTVGAKDTNPINLKSLGEFKAAAAGDPNYFTRQPVEIGDAIYHAYLWVTLDPDDEPEFGFELTTEQRAQKLSEAAQAFKARLKQRLAKPAILSHRDPNNQDDIPF
jgi:hypothetical protein